MGNGIAVRTGRSGWRFVAAALVGIGIVVGTGWGIIEVVDAIESEGCGSYGGGYCTPEPGIRVEPSADLVDGQTVRVNGRGFLPSTSFGVAQCDPSVPGIDGCDLANFELTTTESDGKVRVSITLRRMITIQGRRVDCALTPCTVGAATLDGTTPIEPASAPVTFDPSVPPIPTLRVRLTVDGATDAYLTGTVTCSRSARAFVDVFVEQHLNGRDAYANAFSEAPIGCGPTPRTWTIPFAEGSDRLTTGPARYAASASASDDLDSVYTEQSGTIQVVRTPRGDVLEAPANA